MTLNKPKTILALLGPTLMMTLMTAATLHADDKPLQIRMDLGGSTGTSGSFSNSVLTLKAGVMSPDVKQELFVGLQAGVLVGGGTLINTEGPLDDPSKGAAVRVLRLNYTNRYWDFDALTAGPVVIGSDGSRYRVLLNPFGARGARETHSDMHWHPTVGFEFEKNLHDKLVTLSGSIQAGVLYESVGDQSDVGSTVTAIVGPRVNLGDLSFGVDFTADTQGLKEVHDSQGQSLRADRSFTDIGANAYVNAAF